MTGQSLTRFDYFLFTLRMSNPIVQGAYIHDAPYNPAAIDDFAHLCGIQPSLVSWYQEWNQGFQDGLFDAIVNRNAIPMLTWEPKHETLANIAAGFHDGFITQFAQAAASWDQPFLLRFAHEMNGDWYPWGIGNAGNSAQLYKSAWRHIHNIFGQASADKVSWVWCPNCEGPYSLTDSYPGGDVVNYVGLDGYNWGNTQPWSSWRSFSQTFQNAYSQLTQLTPKELIIGEMSSTESGGSKPNWITDAYATIPTFSRIKAVVWFHEDKEQEWRINSSEASRHAYAVVAQSPGYQGKF